MGPRRGLRGSWGSRESVATKAGAAAGGGTPVGSIRLRTYKTPNMSMYISMGWQIKVKHCCRLAKSIHQPRCGLIADRRHSIASAEGQG